MDKVLEKFTNVKDLQDRISSIIKEVEKGGVYYRVLRYSEPKVAIVNLKDLEEKESFICRTCGGRSK